MIENRDLFDITMIYDKHWYNECFKEDSNE